MPLNKPNQELYEGLDGHAAVLDWTSIELIEIAKRINDAGLHVDAVEFMEISKTLKEHHLTIITVVDDIQDGLIFKGEL